MSVCAEQARVERQQTAVGHQRRQDAVQLADHRRVTTEEPVIQPATARHVARTHRLQHVTMLHTHTHTHTLFILAQTLHATHKTTEHCAG